MLYAVIIAGGAGKRLWPMSRPGFPKFFLNLKGKKTLLQDTVSRVKKFIPKDNIIIITNKRHLKIIYKQLPGFKKLNIIAEPVSRNTAAAVCVAASFVRKKDPKGVIFVMPADHVMEDSHAIKEIFGLASFVSGIRESIITLGIRPDHPSCGFGYIRAGRLYRNLISDKKYSIYKVDRFIEKPDPKRAKYFLKSKRYFWNSGIFIGRASVFLDEFKRYKPGIYKVAESIAKGLGTKKQQAAIDHYYRRFPDISIDYAIMEKTRKAYVIKSDISWMDIGSWQSLDRYLKKDVNGNIVNANFIGMDVKESIVLGERKHLLAAIGIDNIVIIQTKDATLICSKDRAGDVKRLVDSVQKKRLKSHF
ncbi:MAG: sugar phosphate nucleotidyltransferase [Candidatus Omnitrophota bacterium]